MIDFLIPVSIDHPDRIRNLDIVVNYLLRCNLGRVYIGESFKNSDGPRLVDRYPDTEYKNFFQTDDYFNKMRSFNHLANISTSPIIALYDVDVILPKKALKKAEELLQTVDVVYPYDGAFYDVPVDIVDSLHTDLNTPIPLERCKLFNPHSHGGSLLLKRTVFKDAGMCNENFTGWGYDDDEIFHRFKNLEYDIRRTDNPLLHLTHNRTSSIFYGKNSDNNRIECEKIMRMSKESLREYIKTWEWNRW